MKQNDISKFQTANWPALEKMTLGTCPCCDKPFDPNNRPEMTGRCHTGPVFVSYWDSFIYLECSTCGKPICRLPVNTSLL